MILIQTAGPIGLILHI